MTTSSTPARHLKSSLNLQIHLRFQAPTWGGCCRHGIRSTCSTDCQVLLLTPRRLARAASANPFPEAERDPAKLGLYFLAEQPRRPDLELLEGLRSGAERFALKRDVFYLHAPNGIGRSKLAAKVEKALGVAATARNWRTVAKLLELARAGD